LPTLRMPSRRTTLGSSADRRRAHRVTQWGSPSLRELQVYPPGSRERLRRRCGLRQKAGFLMPTRKRARRTSSTGARQLSRTQRAVAAAPGRHRTDPALAAVRVSRGH
jgi:hypothetical protein